MTNNETANIDFSGLVLSFASAALSYMGVETDIQSGVGQNFVLAKQNIEILQLLRDKTRGNLTKEEETLIQNVLTDLKLKFTQLQKTK
ncbi:MAG: DUF1844 domain-containing protein [Oligoflexales bacterium]